MKNTKEAVTRSTAPGREQLAVITAGGTTYHDVSAISVISVVGPSPAAQCLVFHDAEGGEHRIPVDRIQLIALESVPS